MKKRLYAIGLSLCLALPCFAGSQAAGETNFTPEQITHFAKSVEKYAAQQQARAFIIARLGQAEDKLPKGISFTHTAIAIYSNITLANGDVAKGYAIHNLYQKADNLDKSSLIVDYPVDFFWAAHGLKAGIIVPSPELQTRLIEVISSGKNEMLHNENYSIVSNPFNAQFQNCTEHTLDVINAAIYDTTNIQQLKLNTEAHFSPQRVKTNRFKLALGSLFMDELTTRDHQGKVYTTTFTTIAKYLNENNLASHTVVLDENGAVETL